MLARVRSEGWAFVCLDGNLIPSTRSAAPSPGGHDAWYSGKHKRHGGNLLGALYPAAAHGLPSLTDTSYTGARIGIRIPAKATIWRPTNPTPHRLINALRAPAERADALLKRTWKASSGQPSTPG